MPDGIDPTVKRVETPVGEPMLNRLPAHTGLEQLSPRKDPVLP